MKHPPPPPLVRGLRGLAFLLVGFALLDPSFERDTPEPLEVLVMRGDGRPLDSASDPDLEAALEGLAAGSIPPARGWARLGRSPSAPGIRLRTEAHEGIRATVLLGSRLPDDPPLGTPWVVLPPDGASPPPLRVAPPGPLIPETTLPVEVRLRHPATLSRPGASFPEYPLRLEGAFPATADSAAWVPLGAGLAGGAGAREVAGAEAESGILLLPPLAFLSPAAAFPGSPPGGADDPALHPAPPGLGVIRVQDRVHAQFLLHPQPRPQQVLVLEPRPSWGSTFLRRGLEGDARVTLHVRTDLAPGVRSQVGTPPSSVADPAALDPFHLVVVAAPETLDPGERTALGRWVREGGGSLLLLLLPESAQERAGSATPDPWAFLHGGGAMRERRWAEPTPMRPPDRGAVQPGENGEGRPPPLRARSALLPHTLPGAGEALLLTPDGDPVLWEVPRGEGLVVVSGAPDAWEHRDPSLSGWEDFWSALLLRLAHRRLPAVDLRWAGEIPGPGGGVATPGEWLTLALSVRDESGRREGGPPRVTLSFDGPAPAGGGGRADGRGGENGASPQWVWDSPRGAPPSGGSLRTTGTTRFPAPREEGLWWVAVEVASGAPAAGGSGFQARLPLFVSRDAPPPLGDPFPLLDAWARSGGGRVVPHAELAHLPAEIVAAVAPDRVPERWHPMRNPWWILPLVLLLGAEWGWRRQRGRP